MLTLPIKKKWFGMILLGEKKEERIIERSKFVKLKIKHYIFGFLCFLFETLTFSTVMVVIFLPNLCGENIKSKIICIFCIIFYFFTNLILSAWFMKLYFWSDENILVIGFANRKSDTKTPIRFKDAGNIEGK